MRPPRSAQPTRKSLWSLLSPYGDRSRGSSTPYCQVRPGLGNISSRAFNETRAAPLQPLDAIDGRMTFGSRILSPEFICAARGHRGAGVRPVWQTAITPAKAVVRTTQERRGALLSGCRRLHPRRSRLEPKDGHYRDRVPKQSACTEMFWVDVPDDAIITEPIKAGPTMVWPHYPYAQRQFRTKRAT
jgi:hypothetical protein